jgi:cobalt-zinc-cadmium resistance protein CzcA
MAVLGVPGNLMSLGAIDFGLLVDGAVVMVEAIFCGVVGRSLSPARVSSLTRGVARPVFFSVLVILLVYVPILTLTGVDGKMFRPMAAAVTMALLGALVLSLTFVPAAAAAFLRGRDVPAREPWLVRAAERLYAPVLAAAVRAPTKVAAAAVAALVFGAWLFSQTSAAFVPQLDEGDLVIQVERSPDISIEAAVRDASAMERALLGAIPEVRAVVARIGSPAVATDIMGIEQADVFVELAPRSSWRPGLDRDALVAEIEATLDARAPADVLVFTQPIQMRFNELLGGAVTDVTVSLFGDDLAAVRGLAEEIAAVIGEQPGAEDVRIMAPPDVALLEVRPRMLEAGRHGMSADDVLRVVQAIRTGVVVAHTYDGPLRLPIRVRLGEPPPAAELAGVKVPTSDGGLIELEHLATIESLRSASLVNHDDAQRRVVVGFNIRGAALGEVVEALEAEIPTRVAIPRGVRLEWGGQFESLAAARERLAYVIPAVLAAIIFVLIAAFGRLRPALIVITHVPFACVGGILALHMRGLPLSLSAAIGFIALSGIAVLNGVVLVSRITALVAEGLPAREAAAAAARSRMRPVLMTALVAALGFVPMMLATGTGAEVQRPLATVVVGGLVSSTLLTLIILPALYPFLAARTRRVRPEEVA